MTIFALVAAFWLVGRAALAIEDTVGLSKIVAGATHKCGLTVSGGVRCWGYNYYGQLGDNTKTARSTPGDVAGLAGGVVAIAVGNSHTCALTAGGGVKCWGYNFYGQLGDNSTANRLAPVDVQGLGTGVSAIAAGLLHTCALTASGGVKCWGYNSDGELGDGTTIQRLAPVDVAGLPGPAVAIAAQELHTCAQTAAGGIKCWGHDSTKWEANLLRSD